MDDNERFKYALGKDPDERAVRLEKVQRLIRERTPDRALLVEALMALAGVAEERAPAEFLSDDDIPLEERKRYGMPFSEDEINALKKSGFEFNRVTSPEVDPLLLGYRRVADLLLDSLTVEEVAKLMGVTTSTVNELASDQKLYSLERQIGLRIFPDFQFYEDGVVPGFHEIAPHIPRDMSVAGVASWFTLKNPDLFENDDPDQTLSPVDWLRAGYDPEAIVRWLIHL